MEGAECVSQASRWQLRIWTAVSDVTRAAISEIGVLSQIRAHFVSAGGYAARRSIWGLRSTADNGATSEDNGGPAAPTEDGFVVSEEDLRAGAVLAAVILTIALIFAGFVLGPCLICGYLCCPSLCFPGIVRGKGGESHKDGTRYSE